MKRRLLARIGVLLVIAVVAFGCYLLPAIFGFWPIPEFLLRPSFSLSPGAHYLKDVLAGYGTNFDIRAAYYWTPDGLEDVRSHYSVDAIQQIILRPQFIWANVLYGTSESTGALPGPNWPSCSYTEYYTCVEVTLFDLDGKTLAILPKPETLSFNQANLADQLNLASPLSDGTIIIYGYVVPNG
jgi:hypothetical protein